MDMDMSVAIWVGSDPSGRGCKTCGAMATPAELAVCARLAATKAADVAKLAADAAWGTFNADLVARQASIAAKTHSVQMEALALAAEIAAAAAAADEAAATPDRSASASSARPRSRSPSRRRR